MIGDWIIKRIKAVLPFKTQDWLRKQQRIYRIQWPRTGAVQDGDLRRVIPISRVCGYDRGVPIDRYYIEKFIYDNTPDIQGHVLEIGDDSYTRKFGGSRVTKTDVLHYIEGNPKATIVADLTRANHIPSDTFDCIIFTQTLQMIYDFRLTLHHLYRIMKPGGGLLVTSHGITKICRREGKDPWGEYWHFTSQSMQRIFQEFFPVSNFKIKTYGNVLTAIASLHGMAAEDLQQEELDYNDPDYEVLITVRALKPN